MNKITFCWVKAHVGHQGNEKADELAKIGADVVERCPDDLPSVSNKALRKILRDKVLDYWQDWTIGKTGKTINLVARPNTSFQKLTKLKQFYSLLALDVYLLLPYMLLPVITFSTDINT